MTYNMKMATATFGAALLLAAPAAFSVTQGRAASTTSNTAPQNNAAVSSTSGTTTPENAYSSNAANSTTTSNATATNSNVVAPGTGDSAAATGTGIANTAVSGTTAHTSVNRRTNWETERLYWHDQYSKTPYYRSNADYSMYEPAYKYGYNIYQQNTGQPWDRLNKSLIREGWEKAHGDSNLQWDQAQDAVRDSYLRAYNNRDTIGENTVTPAQVVR